MVTAMESLDRATLGRGGYRESFQAGETLDGTPLVDHQQPHVLFVELARTRHRPVVVAD